MRFLSISLALAAAATSLVSSTPVDATDLEARETDCMIYKSGYLAANVDGNWKSFTVNRKEQVSYIGNKKNPLYVQFKACKSLEDRGPGRLIEKVGIIYVPQLNKCIGITNQPADHGPYWTMLVSCDKTSYSQQFLVRTKDNDSIYWKGKSDEEGTNLQGGCGLLGYKSNAHGVPITTHDAGHQINIVCGGRVFHLAKKPH